MDYPTKSLQTDGFRFDFTKGFTNTPGDGSGFDQSRINILTRKGTVQELGRMSHFVKAISAAEKNLLKINVYASRNHVRVGEAAQKILRNL